MAEASLTMAFDPDPEILVSAYETGDDLGRIIRAHFAIERQIERLIASESNARVDGRTSFFGKVNLLRAMRTSEKICMACEAINDLRNQFAHNPTASIANTRSISNKFLTAVESLAPILPRSNGVFVRNKTGVEHRFKYSEANQAQRIVVAAAFLSAAIGVLPKLYRFDPPTEAAKIAGLFL